MALLKKFFSSARKSAENNLKTETSAPENTEETNERCAYCGRLTEIKTSTPVSLRTDYLSGVGQLCPECFEKLSK